MQNNNYNFNKSNIQRNMMWRLASLCIKKQHHVMLMANFVMTRPTSNLHDNVVLVRQHGVEVYVYSSTGVL